MNRLVPISLEPGAAFVDALKRAWDDGDAVLPVDSRLSVDAQQRLVTAMSLERPVEPGDAVVVATSGTTGEPKGVVLTHDAVAASARITSEALGATPDDHWVSVLPLAHIGGLSVVMRALLTGTRLTVLPRFDETVEGTLTSVVAPLLQRMDTTAYRRILLGGAAPPSRLPDNVVTTYGMTETGSGVVYDGRPLAGVSVEERDGELWISSPTLLRCYRDGVDPKVNGWYPTGDAGRVAGDGTVEVFGRIAEVINTGGEKVWPVAVERVIDRHPSVNASRVHGEPDATWGERVVVDIEVTENAPVPALEELKAMVSAEVAPYAAPKELRVVKALERTATGKLRRPSRSTSDRRAP